MVFEFLAGILGLLVNLILDLISYSGYVGIFILMMLESALLPIPSEIVMPFSGYLASQGSFNLWYVVIVSSVANLVGSVILYKLGLHLGRKFILKYGKYFLLQEKHLVKAEGWFKKHGDKAIFFSRMLPGVRTVISLPAGIGRMNFKKFSIYTFAGSLPWNFIWAYLGFWFGKNWEIISQYAHIFNYLVILGVIVVVIWYIVHWKNNRKKK